jgi:hypothetical protein
MMNRKNNSAIFTAVLLFFSCQLVFILNSSTAAGSDSKPDCDINSGPCKKIEGSEEILFDIIPKPVKAMRELTFIVTIKGGPVADKLIVTLGMPAMYMGENKIIAIKSSRGTYTGKGVIPRCLSGQNLWQATVETPKGKKAAFLFNVIY